MFGRGSNDLNLWRQILRVLAADIDYHHRLDALLKTAAELIELPACFLYLLDDEGLSFHLERNWRAAAPEDEPSYSETDEHGAADMMAAPSLDIPRTAETETEQFVSTPAGSLYSIPLYLTAETGNDPAALIGLLQVGPLPDRKIPRQVQRKLETIHFPLALAIQQAHQEEALQQRLSVANARSEVGQRLQGSALEVDRFVNLLLELALTATQTEAGFVAIIDAQKQLTVRANKNLPPAFLEQVDIAPETGLFDWSLAAEGGALIVRDFEFMERIGLRSILAVPLLEANDPVGVFALLNFEQAETFAEHNLTLLETFVEQIKLVVQNGRLFQSFTTQYLETVKGLARSLDVRRPHTRDHHERVTQVALALAREMGLGDDQLEIIRTAGLIHDVGMAGIVEIEEGFQADLEHPTIGASMIETLPLPPNVAKAVATHHEWFDGWGFPQGLKGAEIPLEGRILAMAEFIVEMTTENPVRLPWSQEKLGEELRYRRGNQFDPQVADITLDLIQHQRLQPGRDDLITVG